MSVSSTSAIKTARSSKLFVLLGLLKLFSSKHHLVLKVNDLMRIYIKKRTEMS